MAKKNRLGSSGFLQPANRLCAYAKWFSLWFRSHTHDQRITHEKITHDHKIIQSSGGSGDKSESFNTLHPPALIHRNTGSCQRRQSEWGKSSEVIKWHNEHKNVEVVHRELHCLPFSPKENCSSAALSKCVKQSMGFVFPQSPVWPSKFSNAKAKGAKE